MFLIFFFIFSNFLHTKLECMPSVFHNLKVYMRSCVYLYLLPLLLHSIGNLLAYVAALLVTSVCRLLSVRGREGRA